MKKAILPILLLVFVTSGLLALESEPSSTVGFVKYSMSQGRSNFCLPFSFYKLSSGTLTETMTLDDIVGNQMFAGTTLTADRIVNLQSGTFFWLRSSDQKWVPLNSTFTDNTAYQFMHKQNSAINIFLAGTVVKESQLVGTFPPGRRYASLREAGSIPVQNLDLNPGTVGGFSGAGSSLLSDQLINPSDGRLAWYKTSSSSWTGTFTATIPGVPMKVLVRSAHAGFTWTYDPTSRSAEAPATRRSARN